MYGFSVMGTKCHIMIVKNIEKILIIEDERSLSRALEIKFLKAGFIVDSVFNGEDGIRLLESNTYSLILLDLVMPKMDGFAVLTILKAKKNRIPVFVLTNLNQQNDVKRAKELGVKDFFIKSNTPISVIVDRAIEIFKK